MLDALHEYEPWIRLAAFIGVFALLALAQWRFPRRPASQPRARRWRNNLGLVAVNTLALRLLIPAGAVGAALWADSQGWGLLALVAWPWWLELLVAVLVLDFIIYLQHVMFHAVPALWRLHRVHHLDLDFDLTTGLRFHPVEILLSMLIKIGAVLLLGAPAAAVIVFEVLLNATSLFNHSNWRLPLGLDRWLRRLVVTPDMHRVHHSVYPEETNSNFGFNLSWWDRLLGTYRAQPRDGHDAMTIGLDNVRDPARTTPLWRLLVQPFTGEGRGYSLPERFRD